MKRFRIWAVLLVISFAVPLAAQEKKGAVILTVNDQPVYSWEIALLIPQVQSELAGRGTQPKREDVINLAVRRVINSRLLAQEARRRNLKPDSARVDATLAQLTAQAGGRDEFDASLDRLGATYEQLRANFSEKDLVQVFLTTQIEPQVVVTAEEVAAYYDANPEEFDRPDMVRARHILIRLTPNPTAEEKKEARARAVAARQRVLDGEDFAVVATEVSEGREASNGGDMGFFARDSMMPALTDVAFALEIGQISNIIETQFGFHILKVEEKRPASRMTFEEAKEPVRQFLIENRSREKLTSVLAELSETATIVKNAPPGAASANPNGG
jgi:peptidyl-prolyl cis-trans isomerase C